MKRKLVSLLRCLGLKKQSCFFAATLCVLFFACLSACAPQADKQAKATPTIAVSASPTTLAADATATLPDEMHAFVDDSRADYMVGIFAQLPGTLLEQSERTDANVADFPYTGGKLIWNVRLTNGLPGIMRTGFSVLCDGVITEFTLVETGEKMTHLSVDLEGEQIFKIAFTPEFASGIGKIDFQPFGAEHRNVLWGNAMSYPVFAILSEGYQPSVTVPESTAYNTPVRKALAPIVSGHLVEALVQDVDELDELWSNLSARTSDFSSATDCIFEMVTGEPGRYRLTALIDFEPFAFFDGETTIDCTFAEGEMLSFTRPVEGFIPNGTHSFTILAMRLDGDPFMDRLLYTSRHELKK